MTNNLTDNFIESLHEIREKKISDHVINQTKKCLLDYLGVTLAGSVMHKDKVSNYLGYVQSNQSDSTIIGFNRKADIYSTILLNGLSSHIADFDDGVNSGIIHLGSPVISAILPVAEKEKINADKIILGIIAGYESALRIAKSIQPLHKERGYHASGTCGSIGAAVGVSMATGLSKDLLKHALSSAAISAGGLLKALEDGSELKPFNIARAALLGFISANMARSGFLGPDDVLSGKNGFLEVLSSTTDFKLLEFKENNLFAVEQVYFKPYAACRYCHPAIEGVLKLKDDKILLDEIKEIVVSTYYWAVSNHDHTDIKGVTSAKMSIPYSVSVALINGKAGLKEFNLDSINKTDVLSLARKVTVEVNDVFTDSFPEKCSALIKIFMHDGTIYSEQVDHPKGEPENPLTDQELFDKFKSLASYANKTEEEAEKIIDCVMNLEDKLDELYPLL